MMKYNPVNLTCYILSVHSYNIFRLLISVQTSLSMMAPLSQDQVMRVLNLSSILSLVIESFEEGSLGIW